MENNNKPAKIASIVLAAGCSSRLGQMKQLVPYKGQPLLARLCDLAVQVSDEVHCVLGYQAERLLSELADKQLNLVVNPDWGQGMSSSIAAGVKSLSHDVDAVMILLVDQWQLEAEHLNKLIQTWRNEPDNISLASGKPGVQEFHSNIIGPPVIFPCHYFLELEKLTGEQGAKPLIRKYSQKLKFVELPQAFNDLDTPEQLEQLQAYLNG
mgnify:CR=1 FL=1